MLPTLTTCHLSHHFINHLSNATYIICHLSPVICHLSPVICHLSHVICHPSPVFCHLSPVFCHLSQVTTYHLNCHLFTCHLSSILSVTLHLSSVNCHMSLLISFVTCHQSHVTCHLSQVTIYHLNYHLSTCHISPPVTHAGDVVSPGFFEPYLTTDNTNGLSDICGEGLMYDVAINLEVLKFLQSVNSLSAADEKTATDFMQWGQ